MSPLLEMNYLNSPSTQASLFIWDRKEKASVYMNRAGLPPVLAYANASSQAVKILRELINKLRSIREDCVTTEMTTHFILELATSPSLVCQANSFTLDKD